MPPFPPPLLYPKPPFVRKMHKLNTKTIENRFKRVLSEKYGEFTSLPTEFGIPGLSPNPRRIQKNGQIKDDTPLFTVGAV